MTTRTLTKRQAAVAVVIAALLGSLAVGIPSAPAASAVTSAPGSVESVIDRFSDRTDLAWNTELCEDAPVAYVRDVLLTVGADPAEVLAVEVALAAVLEQTIPGPYGVTAFRLVAGNDAVAVRDSYRDDVPVPLHLDHVMFLSPFMRYSPESAPELIESGPKLTPFGVAGRPVVVIDTGYPTRVDEPVGYTLGADSRVVVDLESPTANHGPFIASQIAQLAPGDITLQRVMAETGLLATSEQRGGEEVFDEVALLATLAQANLHSAVVNLSFGTYGCAGEAPAALEVALTTEHQNNGATFVAAAGNDESDAPHYPAAFSASDPAMVVSVGAHDGGRTPKRACFSNFGTITTWAPGVDVVGYIPIHTDVLLAGASGTSFAAPYVAAALAAGHDLVDPKIGLHASIPDDDGFASSSSEESACS